MNWQRGVFGGYTAQDIMIVEGQIMRPDGSPIASPPLIRQAVSEGWIVGNTILDKPHVKAWTWEFA